MKLLLQLRMKLIMEIKNHIMNNECKLQTLYHN